MSSAEIVTTRHFPVEREALFAAFEDPGRLARWFGPAGAKNENHEFDMRPGGRWRFTMRMPDGTAYPMEKTFLDVERPHRIVLAHRQPGHDFDLEMQYDNEASGTRLTWRMRFATAEQLAPIRDIVATANEQNFDRLAAVMQR